jgi:pyrroline-5-carboxylate reductase
MFSNRKIAFIGSGAMAEAMVAGLIRNQLAESESLLVSDPRLERIDELQQRYGVQPFTDNTQAACQADVIVLSIKPQALDKVLSEIKGCLKPDVLILSIVAGAPIRKIAKGLRYEIIVRSMPNTPAQIGEGITVWTAAPGVWGFGRGDFPGGRILPRYGNSPLRDRPRLRLSFHGGHGGCRCTPGILASYC